MKEIIKSILLLPFSVLSNVYFIIEWVVEAITPSSLSGLFRTPLIWKIENDRKLVTHNTNGQNIEFYIYTPNQVCSMRQRTFSNKEPETLEWIDEFGGSGTFFDIGANIGIYSLYYASRHHGKVVSFEPSVFNLRQLAKNISLNNFDQRINVVSNPLSSQTGFASFQNSSDVEGGALSAFGVDFGFDGKKINSQINYSVLGFSLDKLFEINAFHDCPSMIKIDVDGIEHYILDGARKTLASPKCKTVLIEVTDSFVEQSDKTTEILSSSGFTLVKKTRNQSFYSSDFAQTFNQIYVKI